MSSAGQQLVAGRIPGERIATTVETADSGIFAATLVVVQSVTVPLVQGRTYAVVSISAFSSNVAGDQVSAFMQANSTGAQLQNRRVDIADTSSTTGYNGDMYAEFQAESTGDETFEILAQRISGRGNCVLKAANTRPCFLYVNYLSG